MLVPHNRLIVHPTVVYARAGQPRVVVMLGSTCSPLPACLCCNKVCPAHACHYHASACLMHARDTCAKCRLVCVRLHVCACRCTTPLSPVGCVRCGVFVCVCVCVFCSTDCTVFASVAGLTPTRPWGAAVPRRLESSRLLPSPHSRGETLHAMSVVVCALPHRVHRVRCGFFVCAPLYSICFCCRFDATTALGGGSATPAGIFSPVARPAFSG
jgi:hypothetical protein